MSLLSLYSPFVQSFLFSPPRSAVLSNKWKHFTEKEELFFFFSFLWNKHRRQCVYFQVVNKDGKNRETNEECTGTAFCPMPLLHKTFEKREALSRMFSNDFEMARVGWTVGHCHLAERTLAALQP